MSDTLPPPAGEHPFGSTERPLRVAVIGSGPAGFYAAEAFHRRSDLVTHVDVIDRLPVPYGLVRYGVAPDHQSMKKVVKAYEKTAGHDRFRFFGNVQIGTDLQAHELHDHYDQVCWAVGAETDRHLGVPGEDLAGSLSSTAFVGWYNGHPDHLELAPDLSCERVAVVGIGNVAIDVARVLMRDIGELETTDIADYALEALRGRRVREVLLFGRRGAAQAAFSPKEIQEIGDLAGVDLVVDAADVELGEADEAKLADDRTAKKNVDYLRERAAAGEGGESRKVRLKLLSAPSEILGVDGRVTGIRIERCALVPDEKGVPRAKGTGVFEDYPVGMVIRAIGYRGVPVPGVPFHDAWGTIPNDEGRVTREHEGEVVANEYVTGWAKRGPTGLIGTNKADSAATVEKMAEDLAGRTAPPLPEGWRDSFPRALDARGVHHVSFEDWRLLDALEVERGETRGRVREKVLEPSEMLAAIEAQKARA